MNKQHGNREGDNVSFRPFLKTMTQIKFSFQSATFFFCAFHSLYVEIMEMVCKIFPLACISRRTKSLPQHVLIAKTEHQAENQHSTTHMWPPLAQIGTFNMSKQIHFATSAQ